MQQVKLGGRGLMCTAAQGGAGGAELGNMAEERRRGMEPEDKQLSQRQHAKGSWGLEQGADTQSLSLSPGLMVSPYLMDADSC